MFGRPAGHFLRRGFGFTLLFIAGVAFADDGHRIECTIDGAGGGVLRIILVTEADMGNPRSGFRRVEIDRTEEQVEPWTVSYVFEGVPPGEYAIRTYLDTNGNGELDRKGFRPSEPWGFSWNNGPKRGIPRFEDISFMVPGTGGEINIFLQ